MDIANPIFLPLEFSLLRKNRGKYYKKIRNKLVNPKITYKKMRSTILINKVTQLVQIIEDHPKDPSICATVEWMWSDLDWPFALPLVNHTKWFCPSTDGFMINEKRF